MEDELIVAAITSTPNHAVVSFIDAVSNWSARAPASLITPLKVGPSRPVQHG